MFNLFADWKVMQYLTDWRILSIYFIIFILFLKIVWPKGYGKLWSFGSFKFKSSSIFCALIGVGAAVIIGREIHYFPFSWIQAEFPNLNFVGQLLFYGDRIHFRSVMFFSGLILFLYKKIGYIFPSIVITWFSIGVVELTFIPQHFIGFQSRFIGWDWYSTFIIIMVLFLVEWRVWSLNRKPFFILFSVGLFTQYFLLLFLPYWFFVWDPAVSNFIVNPSVSDPVLGTWIFWGLNHLMKVFFTIAFYFIGVKKNETK